MFQVLTPPKNDETSFYEAAREVLEAAQRIGGRPMDVEGFLFSWVSGIRVVVQRDRETNGVIGLCIFQAGQRWVEADNTAHILRWDGPRAAMMGFVMTLCKAIGSTKLYVPDEGFEEQPDGTRIHIVREYPVE